MSKHLFLLTEKQKIDHQTETRPNNSGNNLLRHQLFRHKQTNSGLKEENGKSLLEKKKKLWIFSQLAPTLSVGVSQSWSSRPPVLHVLDFSILQHTRMK